MLLDGSILDTSDQKSIDQFLKEKPQMVEDILQLRKDILADEELTHLIHHKYKIKNTTGYGLNSLVDFEDIIDDDKIILEDGYRKAKRNIDYIENPDELFSRNHIVYKKRGFAGFSDFSMVGNEFEESGFAPLAIAIHVMYFGTREELRVHHFVSESNESISDPAR